MNFNQLSAVNEISIEGFQVVNGDMFAHVSKSTGPSCTLWSNSICFSKRAVMALNNCDRIRIDVNASKRCILIRPVTSSDRDSVFWVKTSRGDVEPRKMECRQFTVPLFEAWGWDKSCAYRTSGQLVTSDKKVMLLFNFSEPEKWKVKGVSTT